MKYFIIPVYFLAFIGANLFVKHFGSYGLWVSSLFLIPFDFVARCLLHETWSGFKLFRNLTILTIASAVVTVWINTDAEEIALASVAGFSAAQIIAGFFYQANKTESWFIKVNGSDLLAIVADSLVFQSIAFSNINPLITGGQIVVKFAGGLLWYFILFKKLKIQQRL